MLALFVPWLLILLLIATIIAGYRKKWRIALFLLAVTLVINWWSECIPFRLLKSNNISEVGLLKVISWNIDGSSGDVLEKARSVRDFLHKHPADIVFVAEFNEQYPRALDSLLSAEYSYTTYPNSLFFQYFYGNTPFFNSRRLKNSKGEWIGVYACSTVFQGDTIDLYGCHLASNNYARDSKRVSPSEIEDTKGVLKYISNTRAASSHRRMEAETLVEEIKKSGRPAIVMGDMNDVSSSPALAEMKRAGLRDSWWELGVGYGATICYPLPYRIDHIMHNEQLETTGIELLDSHGISDHHALYGFFRINK